jgi:ABC-type sugar transport system ATPase subunit
MSEVRLENVNKLFGEFAAVKDVSLTFAPQSTTCLLGPSGCGKTTLLRMVAGLETVTSGKILIGGEDITRLSARQRNIAMVFQYPIIYRGLSVLENIELPLRELKLSPGERKIRVNEAVSLLGLERSLDQDPNNFDNGTRQRVAFARAVARQSSIILFDEPITNVDAASKFRLKEDLKKLTDRLKQTIIYVTHDQNEAMTLADQIVLLKDGSVLQQAPPRQLYNHPAQRFGGWFLGNPGMSFLNHSFDPKARGELQSDLFPFPVRLERPEVLRAEHSIRLVLGLRPEHARVSSEPIADGVRGRVIRKFRGVAGQYLVSIQLQNHIVWAKVAPELGKHLTELVWFGCEPELVTVFDENEQAIASGLKKASPVES